ncbi:MAG: DUF349 domain-containing protein, partial [Gammaproteobacteria bacterium]|nr:DUF349 domain-containing protein [Gammaproteobacteria bacterium]
SSEANADDELWERFKQASDTAYLPCLEYYAEKDKVRAENLKKQITICESLEQLIKDNDWRQVKKKVTETVPAEEASPTEKNSSPEKISPNQENNSNEKTGSTEEADSPKETASTEETDSTDEIGSVVEETVSARKNTDFKKVEKQLDRVDQDWKKNQPIPESERKVITKRFHGLCNLIRKNLKLEKQANLNSRKALVSKVSVFLEMEDTQEAISGVINLQKQWKELGATFFKADREQWQKFRSEIDKVFAKRDEENKSQRKELQENQSQLKALTQQINQLCQIDDSQLKQSYEEFEKLRDSWSTETELPRSSERSVVAAFDKACSKYTEHYSGLGQRLKKEKLKSSLKAFELLQQAEEQLLDGGHKDQIITELQQQISELTLDEKSNSLITARLQPLLNSEEISENEAGLLQLNSLALDAEILLSTESPENCKKQRMALQLKQLQQGLGSSLSDSEKQTEALKILEPWTTIGLISQSHRSELEQRKTKILKAVGL